MKGNQKAKYLEMRFQTLEKDRFLWILVTLFFLAATWIKISQHYTFRTNPYDLALYDAALSNTLRGNFMYTPWLQQSYFSEHFAPILFGIVPLYLIHDGPVVLLLIQAVPLVLGLIPLYYIAYDVLKDKLISLGIAVAYLNYQYLLNGFMFDFHHEIFEPLFIFSMFLFLGRNRKPYCFVFLILALACKEDMPIYLCVFGLYLGVIKKKWELGLSTILIYLIWGVIAIKVIIPYSWPDGSHPSRFLDRWSQYRQTYSDILRGILLHPSVIFGKPFLEHLWRLLFPLAFLPLASPSASILSLPPLLLNTTSNFVIQRSLSLHYALPVVPFLFVALVGGIRNLFRIFPKRTKFLRVILLCFLLLMNLQFYRLFSQSFDISLPDLAGHLILAKIPHNVTIAAQGTINPHLHRSHRIFLLPNYIDPEYVIFDTQRCKWPMSDEEYNKTPQNFITNERFILIRQEEGFYVFKKAPSELNRRVVIG